MPSETAAAMTQEAQTFVDRFRADADFRAEVEADPKSAFAALGVEIPPRVDGVRIVENTEDTFHFVLPPGPNGDLPDDELSGISGGSSYEATVISRITGMPPSIAELYVGVSPGLVSP